MPASLYRLAGKEHPTAVVDNKPVKQVIVQDAVIQVVEEVVAQLETPVAAVVEETVSVITVETPAAQKLVWDATWTRTKLYQFAVDNGVSVNNSMSKTQIIDALAKANSLTT